jgi:hypothetical protein
MNALAGLRSFLTGAIERRAIFAELEVVCLWSAFGLILTALFLAFGFSGNIGHALMAAG